MAKKTNDADFKTYLSEILAEVPEDKRGTVEEILSDDAVASRIRDGYSRQSDYSRNMDALKAEQARFKTEVAEAQKNIAGWSDWYATESQRVAQVQEQLKSYQETYGTLEEPARRTPTLSKDEVAKTVEDMLARRSTDFFNQTMSAADMLGDLKWEHREKFGKPLNTPELLKFCNERGLPLQTGYKEFISDDLNSLRDTELQAQLAKAREEGARAALSKHSLPVTSVQREAHPIDLMRDVKPTNSFDRISAAAASFTDAMNGTQK